MTHTESAEFGTKVPTTGPDDTDKTDTDAVIAAIVADYVKGDMKDKGALRSKWDKALKQAVRDMDLNAAHFAQTVLDALVSGKPTNKVETDYVALIATKAATLHKAAEMLLSGECVPTGIPDGTDLSGVADFKAEPDMKAATGIATQKVSKSTETHDVGAFIASAFEGLKKGTFLTTAQIRTNGHDPDDPDYAPTDGAIWARLSAKGGCTVVGVSPHFGHPHGGTKV